MQSTQDPIKRMPPGGCALLEGSHHEIKEQNKDESFESKVLQMKRYNHLSNNSTTHR
jgi:hypothetical protein